MKLKKKFVETSFDVITPEYLWGQSPDFKVWIICRALLLRTHPRTLTMKTSYGNLFFDIIKLPIFLIDGKKTYLSCKPHGKGLEFCWKIFVDTSFFDSIKLSIFLIDDKKDNCKPHGKGLEFCQQKNVETSFLKSTKLSIFLNDGKKT